MMVVRTQTRGKTATATGPRRNLHPEVTVSDEQRWHLIECCAFFRAGQFRDVEPGRCRRQDVQAATADIDAVIRTVRKRTGK